MERLKELRTARGLLQKDVAAVLGIDRTTYVKYEKGQSEPSFDILAKLADYFGVSVDYLLGKTDIKKAPHGSEALQQLLDESNAHMAIVIGKGKERRIIEVPADAEEIIRSTLEAFKNKEK